MTAPLPVVMHFPAGYPPGETRQFQLSQHLGELRKVVYVSDSAVGAPGRAVVPQFRSVEDVGPVAVVERSLPLNFRRLMSRAPMVAAALHARALDKHLERTGIARYWTYTFGPFVEWQGARSSRVKSAVEVIDPPFSGDVDEAWRVAAGICRRADVTIATARSLSGRLETLGVDATLVPNAVSARLVSDGRRTRTDPPTALYVGTIDWRFDDELFEAVARRRTDVSFVLAGRVNSEHEDRCEQLATLPNVTFTGHISEATKVDLLRSASVGLVPFRVGDIADGVNPTKVYEYCSYGIPVVSVSSEAGRDLSPPVRLADDPAEFAELLTSVLDDQGLADESLAFARSNTWTHRARQVDRLLAAHEGN